jgi:hypothetical protein
MSLTKTSLLSRGTHGLGCDDKDQRPGHPPAIYCGLPTSCLQFSSEGAVEVVQRHHCRQKTFVTLPEIPFNAPPLTVISLPVPLMVHSSKSPVPFHANLTES